MWYDRGPPSDRVQSATNSAALGTLSDRALAQWRAEPRLNGARSHGPRNGRKLAARSPLRPPHSDHAHGLIAAFSHRAEPLPAAALAEAAVLPPSTLVHLGWVVRHLAHVDGYISAAGQEACLTVYGGQQLAAGRDRLSDEFRRVEAPSAAAAQPTCHRLTVMDGDVSAAEAHPLPENIPEHEDGALRRTALSQRPAHHPQLKGRTARLSPWKQVPRTRRRQKAARPLRGRVRR